MSINKQVCMRRIHEISSVCKHCRCNSVVTMVRMRAEFAGPSGRHECNLQTTEPRLHIILFKMFKKIRKPATCEMRSVIRFLNARNMKPADIHHQLSEVYGEHAMSDSMVRRWVRHCNEGRKNVYDDPQSC
jgi:hypothetical protein